MGEHQVRLRIAINESGVIMVPMTVLIVVISIILSTLLLSFQYQQKIQARSRTKYEISNLVSLVQMLTSMPDGVNGCNQNLVAGVFGTTLTELQALSAPGLKNIKMKYPPSANPQFNGTYLLAKNQKFPPFEITGVYFSQVALRQASDPNSYLGILNIEIADAMSSALAPITIPYYFVASGNVLTRCFSTSYVEGTMPQLTLQESLCKAEHPGSTYTFSAEDMACYIPPATP